MTLDAGIDNIANVIQLAIAPVFLLTAVGAQPDRLARAVDRIRMIEEHQGQGAHDAMGPVPGEMKVLRSRMRPIYLAVALDVICALFVGLTIVIAFAEAFAGANLAWLIALLFVAAMLAFIASMAVFLRGCAARSTSRPGTTSRSISSSWCSGRRHSPKASCRLCPRSVGCSASRRCCAGCGLQNLLRTWWRFCTRVGSPPPARHPRRGWGNKPTAAPMHHGGRRRATVLLCGAEGLHRPTG
jgi:hypothetical protein